MFILNLMWTANRVISCEGKPHILFSLTRPLFYLPVKIKPNVLQNCGCKKNVRIRKVLFLNHPVRFVSSALQNFLRFFWLGCFTRCIRKHSKYNTRLYVILVIINCDGNENSEQQNLLRFYVITMRYKSIKYTWMHTVGLWHQYVFQEFNFATNCKYYLWNWSSILIL